MSNAKILKEARELLHKKFEDGEDADDVWLDFTELLVVATAMESDLMWASQLCDIALRECPEIHEGLKTQLEGFREYHLKHYS